MAKVLGHLAIILGVFSSLSSYADCSPPRPPAGPPPTVPAPAPAPVNPVPPTPPPAPNPPPSSGRYEFGNYPWLGQIQWDRRFSSDVVRVAYMAWQFNKDLAAELNSSSSDPRVQEILQVSASMAMEAYELNEDVRANYSSWGYGISDFREGYFSVTRLFTNLGHMLGAVNAVQLSAALLKEWSDVDYCLMNLDQHFYSGGATVIWAPGYFNGGHWYSPWWGSSWWGYSRWSYGGWGYPGWGWYRGWRGHYGYPGSGGGWTPHHPGFGGGHPGFGGGGGGGHHPGFGGGGGGHPGFGGGGGGHHPGFGGGGGGGHPGFGGGGHHH